jgi:hypothetical protein
MKLEGRVPTAEEALKYFDDMVHGRLPKRMGGKGKKKRLAGTWYTNRQYVKPASLPQVTLVTPVAMDLEQAKAKLQRMGQLPKRKPSKKKSIKGAGLKKKKAQSTTGRQRKRTGQWAKFFSG